MKSCRWIIIAIVLSLGVGPVFAEQDFSDVEIKTTHVAGSVYMLEGKGGNIGASVGSDGILIIDDQFAPLSDKIRMALRDLGDGELRFLINTHWHSDHTGGNEIFGQEATIIAHDNVRDRLSSRQVVKLFNMVSEPKPKEALPVITFDDSLSVHLNDEEIKVIHLPHGHTDGDSVIYFTKSNVVHLGDHMFSGMYPFVDLGSGGNVQGYIDNVALMIEMLPPGVKIIPGHGPLSSMDDLMDYHQMLVDTTTIIRHAIERGESLDQIKETGLPTKIVNKWGQGFMSTDRWVEIIYNSYSSK